MGWVARPTSEWRFSNQYTKLELLSIKFEAIGLLEVLNSHIIVQLSVFRLEQHGDQEMNVDGEKYHYTKNS